MTEKRCDECGQPFPDERQQRRTRKRFCSDRCRYRQRDRRRYELDPEGEREKSRAYYQANRKRVIARVIKARQIKQGGDMPPTPAPTGNGSKNVPLPAGPLKPKQGKR